MTHVRSFIHPPGITDSILVVSQVSQKVSAILEPDELLAQVTQLIQERFSCYYVSMLLVDREANEIILRECSGRIDAVLQMKGLRLTLGQGITGRAAQIGQPFVCNDVSKEPHYLAHELLPETRSELAIPLKTGDKVLGVLDVQSDTYDAFSEEDVAVFQVLGDQVAIAIENARLFRSTRRRAEAMQALHDIALKITSQLESEGVVAVILEQAAHLLGVQGSVIGIYDAEADVIRVIAGHNVPREIREANLRPGEGVGGQIVETGRPVVINDLQHWEKRVPAFSTMELPYDAILSVPLRWQGQLFGALSLMDRRERRHFTDDDVRLLSLFADLATIALKKAELYSAVTQLSQKLERKVAQRTKQLSLARDELARKTLQLQRLLANMINIQEEERARIALDLHDESNQLVTAALYEIQAAQQSILADRPEVSIAKLEQAKRLLRNLEAENRRIISGLRPTILDTHGLVPTLKWHVATFEKHRHITCSVQVYGDIVPLPSQRAETAIYRILQESLNNVAAHSQAKRVQILVYFASARLKIVIEDDGVGFDYETSLLDMPERMGLIGMRERAQSIGGSIEILSEIGQGTRIALEVPL